MTHSIARGLWKLHLGEKLRKGRIKNHCWGIYTGEITKIREFYGWFSQNAHIYGRARIYTGGLVTLCKLLRWRHPMYKTYTEVQIIDSKFKTIQTIVRNASHIVITTKTCTSAKRGPSPRVVPLLSPLPAGAHLYGGEELQVIVQNIPSVCPVSVCLFPWVDVEMCTDGICRQYSLP